jgi:endonuclease G
MEPTRGDLHHLFACESRCNSFRGNTPYTEFADFPTLEKIVLTDCGKNEQNGFEPAHGNGAAARAVFYFLLRYSTEISPSELPPERLQMLPGQHDQDPVSDWERHRNAAIFRPAG